MRIEIDSNSGFCYGVVKTIELAEKALDNGSPVYCLGEIVHNEEEVERLKSKGLIIIENSDLDKIHGSTVLIRAHGEPPATYREIASQANTLKEGTCPIVLNLQKKIRLAWEKIKDANGQIVIYGKKDHAEVIGLAGQAADRCIVISNIAELDKIDYSKPVALFSQTTQSPTGYRELENAIRQRMESFFPSGNIPLETTNSICGHVSKRGENLKEFALQHDVIVFVSGTNSSNGKVLFEICRGSNSKSYWVPNADEVKPEWFTGTETVGICGATSTPRWLMEKVADKIETMTN